MKISQMVRAALQVSDLERSKSFYQDVIGLSEVYTEGTAEGGNMHALIGMPAGVTTRVCVLKQPDYSAFGMIGLFEVKNPSPPPIERSSQGSNIGELCMCSIAATWMKSCAGQRTISTASSVNRYDWKCAGTLSSVRWPCEVPMVKKSISSNGIPTKALGAPA